MIGSTHTRVKARRPVLLLVAGVTAALLSACGGGGDGTQAASLPCGAPTQTTESPDPIAEIETAAREEGHLTFYTSVDQATAQKIADEFCATYGIETTFTRLPSGDLSARYAAEAESGSFPADLIMMTEKAYISEGVEKGWMISADETSVPNIANLPDNIVQKDSVPFGIAVKSSLVINTDAVPEGDEPTTWEELLDPRWKGELYEQDARASGVWLAVAKLLRDTFGEDYVRSLVAQDTEFVDSMVTGVQQVAAGERDGALGASETHLNPLLAEAPDAPVKLVRLQDLQFGYEWALGISADSDNVEAAKLFANWLLTDEGQVAFNTGVGNSIFPDVEIEGFAALPDDFVMLDIEAAQAEREELLEMLDLPE